jgi:signal transduction histidine kinase
VRLAVVGLLLGGFGLSFIPLYHRIGDAAAPLIFLWVVPAGILMGFRAGLAAGLLSMPITTAFFTYGLGQAGSFQRNWVGVLTVVGAGAGAGWARHLVDRFRGEIAQRVRAERETASALREAKRASEAKSAFLARMSHELRTPLTSIRGYAELLLEDCDAGVQPPKLSEDLGRILAATHHLTSLIEDLLDVANIEAGRVAINSADVELAPLVHEVADVARPLALAHRNRLEVDLAQAPATLRTDATRLRQVLLNLVTNAAKFTADGRIDLRVKAAQRDGEPWVELSVSDTGVGMTPEEAAGLFQDFYQVRADGRNEGGSGLGLAISKQLCLTLGGDIAVQTERGKGSCFLVSLPARGPAVHEVDQR